MTSIVDTSVKIFWSGMSNVPQLTGQAGSLTNLLDACLVTGCDVKPVTTITIAAGVATVSFAGTHSALLDSVILLDGITGALTGLNGEQKVTARPTSGALTFATAEADGTAAGAITMRLAPAGWIKKFTGTNKAVYTSGDPRSLGMLLRVDDSSGRIARVVGYESMTDIDTGMGPFPTAAMLSGGAYWTKSSVANTTAVPWLIAADSRTVLFWVSPNSASSASNDYGPIWGFGDMVSSKPGGDAYACALAADAGQDSIYGGLSDGAQQRLAMPRDYTGLGSSVWMSNFPYIGSGAGISGMDGWHGAFPSPITGEMELSRRYLSRGSAQAPRCDVPGVHSVPQSGLNGSFSTGGVQPGTRALAGRNLLAVKVYNNWGAPAGGAGFAFIDQTGPWR